MKDIEIDFTVLHDSLEYLVQWVKDKGQEDLKCQTVYELGEYYFYREEYKNALEYFEKCDSLLANTSW
jgi:tetratricopeptide (TPR) repeat protein